MYIFIDKYLGGSRSALALIRILWRWVAEIVGAVGRGWVLSLTKINRELSARVIHLLWITDKKSGRNDRK